MPPNLACTHGPATGTFPARDSPGNWGENRQIFSKSLLQHFSEAQQGSPAAHRTGEQAAAMRARQPRGKDGHSPLRLLPPRFGMVSHPMGHSSLRGLQREGLSRGVTPSHVSPWQKGSPRVDGKHTARLHAPTAKGSGTARCVPGGFLGPSGTVTLVSCVSLPNPRCQQELGWQKHFEQ